MQPNPKWHLPFRHRIRVINLAGNDLVDLVDASFDEASNLGKAKNQLSLGVLVLKFLDERCLRTSVWARHIPF